MCVKMVQYLVRVQDKYNIDFLEQYGSIVHVSRFSPVIILNGKVGLIEKLGEHPNVITIIQADKLELAPMN